MSGSLQLVIFSLDEQMYGLNVSVVERIIRAVEVFPLPEHPANILGAVNFQGRIIPVVDASKRSRSTEREINLSDRFIVAGCSGGLVALVADEVMGIVEVPEHQVADAMAIMPGLKLLTGLAQLDGAMILVLDPDAMLSPEQQKPLDMAVDEFETTRDA